MSDSLAYLELPVVNRYEITTFLNYLMSFLVFRRVRGIVLFCFTSLFALSSFLYAKIPTNICILRASFSTERTQTRNKTNTQKKTKNNMLYKYPACIVICTILVTFIVFSPIGICFCPDNIFFGKIL